MVNTIERPDNQYPKSRIESDIIRKIYKWSAKNQENKQAFAKALQEFREIFSAQPRNEKDLIQIYKMAKQYRAGEIRRKLRGDSAQKEDWDNQNRDDKTSVDDVDVASFYNPRSGIQKDGDSYVNRGKSGKDHGKFATKEDARQQQKAMYANGWTESSRSRRIGSMKEIEVNDLVIARDAGKLQWLPDWPGEVLEIHGDTALVDFGDDFRYGPVKIQVKKLTYIPDEDFDDYDSYRNYGDIDEDSPDEIQNSRIQNSIGGPVGLGENDVYIAKDKSIYVYDYNPEIGTKGVGHFNERTGKVTFLEDDEIPDEVWKHWM